MSVFERLALRNSRQRAKTQLAAELTDDIAVVIAELSLGALGITDPTAYYALTSEASVLEWAERNHGRSICVVQQNPAFRMAREISGTPS